MGNKPNCIIHEELKKNNIEVSQLLTSKALLFDQFNLQQNIVGSGHFAFVHIAQLKVNNDVSVAIKTIDKKKLYSINDIKTEIQVLKTVDHPNIVTFYGLFEEKEFYHLITEYLQGGSLSSRIYDDQMNENLAAQCIKQILTGINYMNFNNLVHRDLKPDNIIFEKKGSNFLKIIDMGFTLYQEKNQKLDKIGTPYYIAPEIFKGQYDEKCDIWSIGIILYECISQHTPFQGSNKEQLYNNIQNKELELSGECFDDVCDNLKDFLRKLLEKDPKRRLSAAEALNHPWIKKTSYSDKKLQYNKFSQKNKIKIKQGLSHKLKKNATNFIIEFLSKNQIEEMRQQFIDADTEKTGHITFSQLKKVLQKQKDENIQEELKLIFDNEHKLQDEYLNYHEFLEIILDHHSSFNQLNLKITFENYDIDHDGYISKEDLKEILIRQQEFKDSGQVEDWIQDFDYNQDNKIDFQEFQEGMNDKES